MSKKEALEFLRKNPNGLEGTEFVVRRKVTTIKKTLEIEKDVLEQFMAEAKRRGLKIKEAIGEAIEAWLKSKP